MVLIIRVDEPIDNAQGIKEAVAMRLEPLGRNITVIEIRDEKERQETLWKQ